MKRTTIAAVMIAVLFWPLTARAQKTGALIVNPEISGFMSVPFGDGGRIIRADSRTEPPENPNRVELPKVENPDFPAGALIQGRVPDPTRGWAVAVTHDREEFERALPEYRRLIAEGRTREAREVLHVSTSMNVSTRVEQFRDREKLGELPEKVGTFFFTFGTHEFKKYGGYLTFLSYTPDRDEPVAGIGKDIGETIHGILQVETTEGRHGFEFGYAMKIILADVTGDE